MLDNGSVFSTAFSRIQVHFASSGCLGTCYLKNLIGLALSPCAGYVLLGRGVFASGLGGFLFPGYFSSLANKWEPWPTRLPII